MEIKQDMDFRDLQNNCWGQATEVLEEISNADLEDALMSHLEEMFYDEIPDLASINDYLAYDWETIYESIGLSNWSLEDDIDVDTVNELISQVADYTNLSNRYITDSDVEGYSDNEITAGDASDIISEVHKLMVSFSDALERLLDSDEDDWEDNLSDAENAASELSDYCYDNLTSKKAEEIADTFYSPNLSK